jgi:hypothetical protein
MFGYALSTTRENTFCVVSLFVFCELYIKTGTITPAVFLKPKMAKIEAHLVNTENRHHFM